MTQERKRIIDLYNDLSGIDLYGNPGNNVHFYIDEGHISFISDAVFEFDFEYKGDLTENTKVKKGKLEVFEFYLEGIQQGGIPEEIEQYASLASVWTEFAEKQADMADIATTSLLTINEATANVGYRFVPTLNGSRVSLAETWAFAVLAQEGEQRRVAVELLDVLLEPAIHGEWSQLAHRLPTQPAALDLWPSSNEYYAFLRSEAAPLATSQPNGRLYQEFSIRFQEALRGVLNGSLTPADAVLQVRSGP